MRLYMLVCVLLVTIVAGLVVFNDPTAKSGGISGAPAHIGQTVPPSQLRDFNLR